MRCASPPREVARRGRASGSRARRRRGTDRARISFRTALGDDCSRGRSAARPSKTFSALGKLWQVHVVRDRPPLDAGTDRSLGLQPVAVAGGTRAQGPVTARALPAAPRSALFEPAPAGSAATLRRPRGRARACRAARRVAVGAAVLAPFAGAFSGAEEHHFARLARGEAPERHGQVDAVISRDSARQRRARALRSPRAHGGNRAVGQRFSTSSPARHAADRNRRAPRAPGNRGTRRAGS